MSANPTRVLRLLRPVIEEANKRGEISPSLWNAYTDTLHGTCDRCGARYKTTHLKHLCGDCDMKQNKEMWDE